MRHKAQKGFCGIFFGIPQHEKWYFVYILSTRKILSSYDVVFDESVSSELEIMSQLYSKAIDVRLSVTYTPYATSSN